MDEHYIELEKAVKNSNLEEIKRLIAIKKPYNYSLIITAAENGSLEILKYLTTEVKSWSFLGYNLSEPLIRAIGNGHLPIVKYFLESNWDHRFNNFEIINKSLMTAIEKNQNRIVLYILDREISKYRNGKNKTLNDESLKNIEESLNKASRCGNLEIIKYLVESGFSVRNNNDIALRLAVREGHTEIINYLLEKGADFKNVQEIDLMIGQRKTKTSQ